MIKLITDSAEITAVSERRIFSFNLILSTPLKPKISDLSDSEKSPSGPTIIHNGFLSNFEIDIFFFVYN